MQINVIIAAALSLNSLFSRSVLSARSHHKCSDEIQVHKVTRAITTQRSRCRIAMEWQKNVKMSNV
jgi:hypothetical protein